VGPLIVAAPKVAMMATASEFTFRFGVTEGPSHHRFSVLLCNIQPKTAEIIFTTQSQDCRKRVTKTNRHQRASVLFDHITAQIYGPNKHRTSAFCSSL